MARHHFQVFLVVLTKLFLISILPPCQIFLGTRKIFRAGCKKCPFSTSADSTGAASNCDDSNSADLTGADITGACMHCPKISTSSEKIAQIYVSARSAAFCNSGDKVTR